MSRRISSAILASIHFQYSNENNILSPGTKVYEHNHLDPQKSSLSNRTQVTQKGANQGTSRVNHSCPPELPPVTPSWFAPTLL